ncbi:MAG TPA: AMP-binding protein [Rubrivivax sp.]|nr:AMP-binding protein [Rubrivivax sp.]
MPATSPPLQPMNPVLWSQTLTETFAAGFDPQGLALAQRADRLKRLLAQAQADSPFYRQRLGARAARLEDVEPVDKAELMRHFDDWATDRRITRASVDDFLADPARLAHAYLGRYLVWTSSGTSGEPGIFVQDERSLAAYDALDALRLRGVGLESAAWPAWSMGQRFAYVAATGGHFAGAASIERLRRIGGSAWPAVQWLMPAVRTFSVQQPLQQLGAALQDFAPTVLITYPSCADALAQAQSEGRLRLRLAEVWAGGEQLSAEQRARIRAAFGCRLHNNYGASECYAIGWECSAGRLHLNHDWVVLEPVDRALRPVPPGETSHAVLLTNLANRTQPLLRYKLDDSVRFLPERCACGNAFPAFEVQGRADHTLQMHDAQQRPVSLLPLALCTAIEEGAQVTRFQVLHDAADRLQLRFEPEEAEPEAAFLRTQAALAEYLAAQGLGNVQVEYSAEPPLRHPRSGKLERVRPGEGKGTARPG